MLESEITFQIKYFDSSFLFSLNLHSSKTLGNNKTLPPSETLKDKRCQKLTQKETYFVKDVKDENTIKIVVT